MTLVLSPVPDTPILGPDGRIPLPLDRAFCELLDTMVATLPILGMRWELVCETCVALLGRVQRGGDPSPDIWLSGLDLVDGTVEMTAVCRHARRVYRGPYGMPPAAIRRPLRVQQTDGAQTVYTLPKTVRDLIVRVDRELRAHGAQMRLFCTVCEDRGLTNIDASVRGDNDRHGSAFRLTCAHAVRVCAD